ncbi:MAG TPA: hypothetical protein VG651_03480 [Stellaceae bacterium]|nr:hypothetical protein [Stellaceae bacterium]
MVADGPWRERAGIVDSLFIGEDEDLLGEQLALEKAEAPRLLAASQVKTRRVVERGCRGAPWAIRACSRAEAGFVEKTHRADAGHRLGFVKALTGAYSIGSAKLGSAPARYRLARAPWVVMSTAYSAGACSSASRLAGFGISRNSAQTIAETTQRKARP